MSHTIFNQIRALLVLTFVSIPFDAIAFSSKEATNPVSGRTYQALEIVTAQKVHKFRIELVDQPETRRRGLMFRRQMDEDTGMLFDFEESREISMWMKDTYISLDMLFIREDGSIARIAENTRPLSLRSIRSGEPVLSVLELPGGSAERFEIQVGDLVRHPLFGNLPSE